MTVDRLHVRPKLRVVYAVDGRPDVLTKDAAYSGSVLAAVAKRCDCYQGSGRPDDPSEVCLYHDAITAARHGYEPEYEGAGRRLAVLVRLGKIHKAQDKAAIAAADRPVLDLSHMREDDLHEIAVAIDGHLANGKHKPARRGR